MIKYLGSKRTILPVLVPLIQELVPGGSVLDAFSGTSRVGHALKQAGHRVIANDHNAYARTIGACYVQADREDHVDAATQLVEEFNRIPGSPGYFTETFCVQSRFFRPENGARVDAIREEIVRKSLPPELEAVMLVSLMEAADRVDSTTGVQMAYLKQWAPRALNPLTLRVPDLLPRAAGGKGAAWGLDAVAAATAEVDLCYLDPPYNQHKYLGNYHIWETLVRWDQPEVYGVACKRVDCRTRGSRFNSRPDSSDAFRALLSAVRAPTLVVSFSDEGFLSRAWMEATLQVWAGAPAVVLETSYARYVGARIGIYNPRGEKVGTVGKLRNTEYLYVASKDPAVQQRAISVGLREAR